MRTTHRVSRIGGVGLTVVGLAALCIVFVADFTRAEENAASIAEALKGGTPSLDLRYRIETVADDAPAVADHDAWASTLRTTLGYRTLPYENVSAFLQFENVTSIGHQRYNNLGAGDLFNGITDRPVVADPEITALVQGYADITAIPETHVRFGRDELAFDDQRFVGPVAWRQHHQSFDAFTARNNSIENVTLNYAFVWNVHRVFGDNMRMATHLLNASYQPNAQLQATAFYYRLDYDRPANAGLSTGTFGVRANGAVKLDGWSLPYQASFANQKDAGDNPANVDANYAMIEVGVSSPSRVAARVGIEALDGSPTDGRFQTPLATLHKFNGFADKFLVTPVNGLQDVYLEVGGHPGAFTLSGTYHWFSAAEGNAEYGTELDLLATYKSNWGPLFGFKGAIYNADTHAFDTQKLMLWVGYAAR